MPIRSTFVYWSQALREPDRLLDDLRRSTRINTLEMGLSYSTSGLAGGSIPAGAGQKSIIASNEEFDVEVPVVTRSDLARFGLFISSARSKGFKIACNYSPLYIPTRERRSMACASVTGALIDPPLSPPQPLVKPVSVYGCPNNPDVTRFGETMIREIVAAWAPAEIITINHVEFPMWPGRRGKRFLIEDLFSCFCDSCEEKARASGIDFRRIRSEVSSLYRGLSTAQPSGTKIPTDLSPVDVLNTLTRRPELATWLRFRLDSMTEYVNRIVKAGREAAAQHNPGLQMGLEFQLPALSNLLGTDFVGLAPSFDFLVPKFPDYLTANTVPIVADTIATSTKAADTAGISRIIRELLDLGPGPKEYRRYAKPHNMLYDVPFELSMIDQQMKYLDPVAGKVPMYPYIWLEEGDADLMKRKVQALKRHGIDGYFIWQWEEDLSHRTLEERRGVY